MPNRKFHSMVSHIFSSDDVICQRDGYILVIITINNRHGQKRLPTHVKTHKLLQVCQQVVTNLFTRYQQVVFALLVPSFCNKFGTSC